MYVFFFGTLKQQQTKETLFIPQPPQVAPPPGRPPASQPQDLRQRRFVQIDTETENAFRA